MAELVTMPKLGFDMAEGTLVRWVKAEGDLLDKGEVIAEIETDKATVEVESNYPGKVYRHLIEEGTTLPVNAPIAVITEENEEPSEDEIVAMTAGGAGTTQMEEKREKSNKEKPGSQKEVQQILKTLDVMDNEPAGGVRSSPLARRMAEEYDVQLKKVKGSGPQGRVVKQDIESYLQIVRTEGRTAQVESVEKVLQPLTDFTAGHVPDDEVIEKSKLRQAIGRRMQNSNENFPHFYLTRSFKTEKMMKLRKELNLLLTESEKLSVNDFIVKGVGLALRQYPNLNASLEDENHFRLHGHVNIGVAVAVEGGLLTVVCKDVDQKPLRLIAREIREMAARARGGKVRIEDIEGSTFSVSNLGMYGLESFSAIINPPEAGILAVAAVQDVPVVGEDGLSIGSRMKATLSADHRVTDGAEAAEFMQVLASYIEEPMRLLI